MHKKIKPDLGFYIGVVLAFSVLLCIDTQSSIYAASFHEQQKDLQKLQKRIGNLQKQIRKDTRLRDESQVLLETIDQDIAATRHQLIQNKIGIESSDRRIQKLNAQQELALGRMGKQQKQLSALLKLAYQKKQIPALKLFLNQNDPAKLGRQIVYYRHLMQAQESEVGVLTEQVRAYVGLLEKANLEKSKLQTLQDLDKQNLQSLENSRQQRTSLVKQLAANIKDQTGEVKKLIAEEKALNQIITELERTLESFPDTRQQAFKNFRGKLSWPVQGKLVHRYGQARVSGQSIKWKGVFVSAERSTEVRAVAYGRVVYADWLPGHGLITILDHGDNYLSLYANAEMLFKEVGDWVQSGEIIATVGDSGGNKNTGLYFEIRKGKTAMNPSSWFTTRSP